jgi:hypothetical protein
MQEYRVQAIVLLKRSIELELSDYQNTLRTDRDLDSLRELDEFQELLREIEPESEESGGDIVEPDEEA